MAPSSSPQKPPLRPRIAGGLILFLLSILLIRTPLLNYLGYEFSFAIALAVPWVVGIPVIRMFRRRFPDRNAVPRADFNQSGRDALIQGWTLLLVPLAVATVNCFVVRNCSYGEGLLFYLLIPVVTVFWSVGLALFCATMFRRAFLVYSILILACFLYPIYTGYFSPQIYSYNFVYGFFPGFSYDEVLTITPRLLLFRLITILCGLFFWCVADLVRQGGAAGGNLSKVPAGVKTLPDGRWLRTRIVVLGLLLATGWLLRVQLGFETTRDSLERELGSTYSTEHFRIFYSQESISPSEIGWIAALHEYRFSQVEAALQIKFHGTITSYIYSDGDTKLRLIGTKTTNIAKPWRGEIHLDKNSIEGTLKHELVHVLAGQFGMPVIRAHYHIGLVEGLAMSVDPEFGNRTLDQYAAAIRKFDLVHDPRWLISPIGFATRASSVSYVLMGSFCKYLIDRYGIVLFRSLYGGKAPSDVYGKSYDGLVDEWQKHLGGIEIPDSWRKHVEYYFDRPSIFAKECAREVAKRNEEGYRNLAASKAAAAIDDFSSALKTSWNTESYAGLVRASFSAGKYDTVVQLIEARKTDSLHRSSLINLDVLYGDALWYRGDVAGARRAYGEILGFDISENLDEAAAIRMTGTEDPDLRRALPGYLVGSLTDSSALKLLADLAGRSTNPIIPYLEGRLKFRQKNYPGSIELMQSRTAGISGRAILDARREQLIGEAYFRLRNFQQARAHFWVSLNSISNDLSVQRVDDWLDRCEWFEQNGDRYIASRH
jgi:tetratricopeptide (TPR) repeat protein